MELLNETQSLEFSLRELARRAGVTHNAPYKHFADKRDLLAAVSAAGFEMLTKRMAREIAGLRDPQARLTAMMGAYIYHGVEHPALYQLMFGGYLSGPDERRPAIERAAAEDTKALLASAIIDGALGRPIPKNARNERKISGAILACWSLVHGLTLLVVDGLVGPPEMANELCAESRRRNAQGAKRQVAYLAARRVGWSPGFRNVTRDTNVRFQGDEVAGCATAMGQKRTLTR